MDIINLILSKKYIEDTLAGAGALAGKSAYDIACDNGFNGTPIEWLASLQGDTPTIGPSGTWVIGDYDTGVIASPSLAGYATEDFVKSQLKNLDLTEYAKKTYVQDLIEQLEMPEGTINMIALTTEEILAICK